MCPVSRGSLAHIQAGRHPCSIENRSVKSTRHIVNINLQSYSGFVGAPHAIQATTEKNTRGPLTPQQHSRHSWRWESVSEPEHTHWGYVGITLPVLVRVHSINVWGFCRVVVGMGERKWIQ